MKPPAVPISDLYLSKVTSQKIFVSAKTKPSKSDLSNFRKPTQLTKLAHFHQLMPLPYKIDTTEGIDGVAEDKILTITQSTSEDSIHKSKTSGLRNPTQMIKKASCQQLNISKSKTAFLGKPTQMIKIGIFHRLMPRTWQVVTA